MEIKKFIKALLATFVLPALSQNSFAQAQQTPQVPLEPKGMQVEIRDATPQKPAATAEPKLESAVTGVGNKAVRKFKLRAFAVSGNTQVTTQDLLAAAGNLPGAEPVSVGYDELQSMAQSMTALYRQRGFAVAVVQLLAQDISDGSVIFTATEGRLSDFVAVSLPADVPLQLSAEAAINSAIPSNAAKRCGRTMWNAPYCSRVSSQIHKPRRCWCRASSWAPASYKFN